MLSIFKSRPVGHLQAVTLAQEQLDSLNHDPNMVKQKISKIIKKISNATIYRTYRT